MPLPPLLLERLKRRKIIQEVDETDPDSSGDEPKSNFPLEVSSNQKISSDQAEQNDDPETSTADQTRKTDQNDEGYGITSTVSHDAPINQYGQLRLDEAVIGCPHKYNVYHECNQYCIENYSHLKQSLPTTEQRKRLALILKAYPISNEWTVVWDPGVRTFYFWNIITNLVSWLPPGMNGQISLPADVIRKSMRARYPRDETHVLAHSDQNHS